MKKEQIKKLKEMLAELETIPYAEETLRDKYRGGLVAYLAGVLDGVSIH